MSNNLHMLADQSFLDDSLQSTIAGRPITKTALLTCTPPNWKAEGLDGATHADALLRQGKLVE